MRASAIGMEEAAAFESVLAAFIETYDVAAIDASDADADADADADDGSHPPTTAANPAAQGKEQQRRASGRKRGSIDSSSGEDAQPGSSQKATSYTTMLQRRKRAEVQTLREQVTELEAHLGRLQRARWGPLPKPRAADGAAGHRRALPAAVRLSDLWESFVAAEGAAGPLQAKVPRPLGPAETAQGQDESKFLESAVAQYRLRRRSELKNRQLKQLMSQQMHLNSAILRLMQKRAMFPGLEILLDGGESERPAETVEYRIPNAEIESEITQLYREVDLVVDRLAPDWLESVSCSMETKHDPAVGKYVEVRTVTPVNHSAAQAAMRVWRKTCSNPDQHLSFFSETTGSESYVKRFFLPIARREEREGGDVLLNVRHHARKFDEAKRFVTVMYAIVQPPVSSMYLREDSWTVVSPSPTNPRHESIVQTCYRIHSKMSEPDIPPTEEAADMCTFVMTALGRLTRRNMQTTQNWLLEEASSPFPDWILT